VADLPSVLSAVAKNEGVLHALYSDLAAPGVRQVGKALETVFKTGNILLLPLRMLNEYAANVERQNFEEIAGRFAKINDDDIVDVRPEIGTPVLEKLSITEDPDLRRLFIELLASAADRNKVEAAHPSFVRVIESLSPDEAHILQAWKNETLVPCLTIARLGKDNSTVTLRELVVRAPAGVSAEKLLPVYIANMTGLGLLRQREDAWLADPATYVDLIEMAKSEFPGNKDGSLALSFRSGEGSVTEGDILYQKGCIQILSYGRVFQHACLG
jgi:hypothetical protein